MNRRQANAAPVAEYQRTPGRSGVVRAPADAAVVEMVRLAIPAAVPVMLTGLVEPKLNVGKSCAPAGLDVTAAVRATLPVKPPLGFTTIVVVPDTPGPETETVGLPDCTENVPVPVAEVTVMLTTVLAVVVPEVPVTVTV
jgi:hypothetical protein